MGSSGATGRFEHPQEEGYTKECIAHSDDLSAVVHQHGTGLSHRCQVHVAAMLLLCRRCEVDFAM